MNADRLSELQTLDPQDAPDDARIAITARDLRDLVALVPVVPEGHAACSNCGDGCPVCGGLGYV